MRPQAGGDPAICNHGPAASQGSPPSGLQSRHRKRYKPSRSKRPASGCSSGVEHNLAKVGVEGSNPFARSNSPNQNERRQTAAAIGWPLLAVRTRGILIRLELRLAPDFPSGGGLPRGWVVAVGTPLSRHVPAGVGAFRKLAEKEFQASRDHRIGCLSQQSRLLPGASRARVCPNSNGLEDATVIEPQRGSVTQAVRFEQPLGRIP